MWQVPAARGFVEGVTLRRIFHIPAGTAWGGTFVLNPEPVNYPAGARHIAVTAEVRAGVRVRDLGYNIYVWPDEFVSEAAFLAHVLQRVREGMERKRNQRGDQQLRVLRVGFVADEQGAPDRPDGA